MSTLEGILATEPAVNIEYVTGPRNHDRIHLSGASAVAEVVDIQQATATDAVESKASQPDAFGRQWVTDAACAGGDPDALFVQGAAQNRAKIVCGGCLVRTECLADALDLRMEYGVWGGMTERERRALLKRRPNIQSWARLLMAAKKEFDATQVDT